MTASERRALEALAAWHQLYGVAPTLRELGRMLGLQRSWVRHLMIGLARQGLVHEMNNQPRCLALTKQGKAWFEAETRAVGIYRTGSR